MDDPTLHLKDRVASFDEPMLEHLRELQRFAEIGRLSASLLHEISNPLTAAILHLDPAAAGTSKNIRHARRNIQILQRYVEAARQQVKHESALKVFYVKGQLEQVRQILEPHARRYGVRLRVESMDNHQIYGDPVKFQQIIANLVKNAIDAYATLPLEHPRREVRIRISQNGGWLTLGISDWGLGMTRDELDRIFEPFYTTKVKAGHGLGIGLTIVKQYVERDFKGSVMARSHPGKGTHFMVKIRTFVSARPRPDKKYVLAI